VLEKRRDVPRGRVVEGVQLFTGELFLMAGAYFAATEIAEDTSVPLSQEEI
jgi:hypothetical protein